VGSKRSVSAARAYMERTDSRLCSRVTLVQGLIMWDEECDIFEALDEHDLETEFSDDFSDMALDAEIDEDAPEEAFDEESLYDDED